MPSLKSLIALVISSMVVTSSMAFPISIRGNEAGVINGYFTMYPRPAFSDGCQTRTWTSQQCSKWCLPSMIASDTDQAS